MDKQIANSQNEQTGKFYRFQVFQGEENGAGQVRKSKSVGMAYLKDGQNIFTLRLWMFSWERYYVLPNKNDASKFLVMTREPNRSPNAKNKYFWNIVGNGTVDTVQGLIRLEFDLLERPIYVSTHPESSAHSAALPAPEELADAA